MRILFVVHQFYPEFQSGTESVTLRLAKIAQQAGHKVEVLCSLSQDLAPSWGIDKATGFYQYSHDDIAITAIKRSDIPDNADYSLDSHGPLVGKISIFLQVGRFDCCHVMHTMRMASAIRAVIDSNIPYLLTITDFYLPCYRVNLVNDLGQLCKGANGGAQCQLDCPTKDWNKSKLKLRFKQSREIVEAAAIVVCPSEFVASHLRQEYAGLPVKTVPHDIDFQIDPSLKTEGKTAGKFVFGYIGSVIEEKGVDLLIKAFSQAFQEPYAGEVVLKIIGQIPGSKSFAEDVVKRVSNDNRIELVGLVPHDELELMLRSIDVLCIPSRVPETFSLVLHEAAALRIPALVSNMGAPRHLVKKTGGGMVVENYDTGSWSSALIEIQQDPLLLVKWQENTQSHNGVNEEANSYLDLYRLAIGSGIGSAYQRQVESPHAPEALNWKKRTKLYLWPKFQARGKARWFLLTLELRGHIARLRDILKGLISRRPIPMSLHDDVNENPPAEVHPELIHFQLCRGDLESQRYRQSITITASGYSLETADPLFVDAYIDNVFLKRFYASATGLVDGGTHKQYEYREKLDLSLSQMGHHQLTLIAQDVAGNILSEQLMINRVPDPQQYDEYYKAGMPDPSERLRWGNLEQQEFVFEIWIDGSIDSDLKPTFESLLDQGPVTPNIHIYGVSQNKRDKLANYLAEQFKPQQFDIEYHQAPGRNTSDSESDSYCVFLNPGEFLAPLTLCQLAEHLIQNPGIELLYTDHDLVDAHGIHSHPQFSPAWSPDYFLQHDYIGGVFFVRRTTWLATCMQEIGDFTDSTWRYELLLNYTDWPLVIEHIPKIMWSAKKGSSHFDIALRAEIVERCLQRRGEKASAEVSSIPGRTRIDWHTSNHSKVSIIIPTTGNLDLLKPCLESILQKTSYRNFELVIIVNGQDRFPEGIEYCQSLGLTTIVDDAPFNWSRLNNRAAAECDGDILLFLNDDVEVLNNNWLQSMLCLVNRMSVGTVGSMLLYPDGTIQHAGVVLVDHGGGAAHYFQWMDPDKPIYNNLHEFTREVSASTGACLMVRRDVYLEAQGFSEELQISGNDIDFCLRIQSLGYRNLWTPDARLIHKESMTRKKNKIPFPDEARMWRLWGDHFLARDPFYSSNFTNQATVCELPKVAGSLSA